MVVTKGMVDRAWAKWCETAAPHGRKSLNADTRLELAIGAALQGVEPEKRLISREELDQIVAHMVSSRNRDPGAPIREHLEKALRPFVDPRVVTREVLELRVAVSEAREKLSKIEKQLDEMSK